MSIEHGPQLLTPEAPDISEALITNPLQNEIEVQERSRVIERLSSTRSGRFVATLLTTAAIGNIAPAIANASGEADTPVAPDNTNTSATIISHEFHGNAHAVAKKHIVIGEDVNIKVDKKHKNDCMWTKDGQDWTNSVRLANGKLYKYNEDVAAKLCRNDNSPTGWVKVAGGETGKPCMNPAIPPAQTHHPVHEDVKVKNIEDLDTKFTLKVKAWVKGHVVCPGVEGWGNAKAVVKQKFSFRQYLKMSGAGQSHVNFELEDKAKAKVALELGCTSTETPPPPPNNSKPECDVAHQAHSEPEDIVRVRMYADDPDGRQDLKHVSLTESGDGEWISNLQPSNNEAGAYYRDLSIGPVDEGEVVVTCNVTDTAGAQGTETERWPIQSGPPTPLKANRE